MDNMIGEINKYTLESEIPAPIRRALGVIGEFCSKLGELFDKRGMDLRVKPVIDTHGKVRVGIFHGHEFVCLLFVLAYSQDRDWYIVEAYMNGERKETITDMKHLGSIIERLMVGEYDIKKNLQFVMNCESYRCLPDFPYGRGSIELRTEP